MPILLCSTSVSTPPLHICHRARPQNYSNGGKGRGEGVEESSGAQRRDKIEGRPVTDLMAARLSIPGFRAATDNSVMRLHSTRTERTFLWISIWVGHLFGPPPLSSPPFKSYICLWKFECALPVNENKRNFSRLLFFFIYILRWLTCEIKI